MVHQGADNRSNNRVVLDSVPCVVDHLVRLVLAVNRLVVAVHSMMMDRTFQVVVLDSRSRLHIDGMAVYLDILFVENTVDMVENSTCPVERERENK